MAGDGAMEIPALIINDLRIFYVMIEEESPDIKGLLRKMGAYTSIDTNEILDVIKSIFIQK